MLHHVTLANTSPEEKRKELTENEARRAWRKVEVVIPRHRCLHALTGPPAPVTTGQCHQKVLLTLHFHPLRRHRQSYRRVTRGHHKGLLIGVNHPSFNGCPSVPYPQGSKTYQEHDHISHRQTHCWWHIVSPYTAGNHTLCIRQTDINLSCWWEYLLLGHFIIPLWGFFFHGPVCLLLQLTVV